MTSLNKFENEYIHSREQLHMALRISLSQIVNSIIVPIVVLVITRDYRERLWLQEGGLADDVFFIAVSNAIVTPLMKVIDIGHRIHQLKRWWYCLP